MDVLYKNRLIDQFVKFNITLIWKRFSYCLAEFLIEIKSSNNLKFKYKTIYKVIHNHTFKLIHLIITHTYNNINKLNYLFI